MSIASEKIKFASERFILVRLNPARALEFTYISGTLYSSDMPFIVNNVQRNGVDLTEMTSIPLSNNQWFYDDSTQTLYVNVNATPSNTITGDNQIICFYYIYLTNTSYRTIPETPTDLNSTFRLWEPRLSNAPTISQNVSDILGGVFSISDTSLSVINEGGYFQQYLSVRDSFYNKNVEIWLCISSYLNIQKVYSGTIRSLSVQSNTVSISCVDKFQSLNQVCNMGDMDNEIYYRRVGSGYPNLDPKANDLPIPFIVGESSRYKTKNLNLSGAYSTLFLNEGTESFCLEYNGFVDTSTNRVWGTCRQEGSLKNQSFGVITNINSLGLGYVSINFTSIPTANVGDVIKWFQAPTTYYGLVCYVGSFNDGFSTKNLLIQTFGGTFTVSSTITNLKSFGLILKKDGIDDIYPLYERDYSITEVSTSGGNKFIKITFVNNFESNHSSMSGFPLHPDTYRLYFRSSNTVNSSHGEFVQTILEKCGLTVNTASITQADSDLSAKCRFHIPNFDESDYKTYLAYLQDILSSVIGYVKLNTDFEVEYQLLETPTSTNERTNSLILDGSFRAGIEYGDIQTTIIGYNPHNDNQSALDAGNSPSQSSTSYLSRYLHGFDNITRFRHVLDSFVDAITRHIKIKSERRVLYNFDTATEDIDTEIGDNLLIESNKVLGSDGSVQIVVTGITKSSGKTSIEGTDLYNL